MALGAAVSTHVESLDAGHPFLGVAARMQRGRLVLSLSADDVVEIAGSPAQVRALLLRSFEALDDALEAEAPGLIVALKDLDDATRAAREAGEL